MTPTKIRKEVTLDDQTMAILKIQAEKQGRNLKNYMEHVLKENANHFEVTEEYKIMMDALLEKHKKGEMNYTPWEDFKKEISSK
jgi:hypothetical protein